MVLPVLRLCSVPFCSGMVPVRLGIAGIGISPHLHLLREVPVPDPVRVAGFPVVPDPAAASAAAPAAVVLAAAPAVAVSLVVPVAAVSLVVPVAAVLAVVDSPAAEAVASVAAEAAAAADLDADRTFESNNRRAGALASALTIWENSDITCLRHSYKSEE